MTLAKRLVLATHNAGKLREFRHLIAGVDFFNGYAVQSAGELQLPVPEEPALTFVENALLKARAVSKATGACAIADDSGLCVNALAGAPGVRSARYAEAIGPQSPGLGGLVGDDANNAVLLKNLQQISDRSAHFTCCVVFLRHAEDPEPVIAQGHWCGLILHEARGTGGFGYDPLFFDPVRGASAAELSLEAKSQVSHRGQAMSLLLRALAERSGDGQY